MSHDNPDMPDSTDSTGSHPRPESPLILIFELDAVVGTRLVRYIPPVWQELLGLPTPEIRASHSPAELTQNFELNRERPTTLIANATRRERETLPALRALVAKGYTLPPTIIYREGGAQMLGQHASFASQQHITVLDSPLDLDEYIKALVQTARTMLLPPPRRSPRRGRPPNTPPDRWQRRLRNRHGIRQRATRRHPPQCPIWWDARPRR